MIHLLRRLSQSMRHAIFVHKAPIVGTLSIVAEERGKVVARRSGRNVCTLTGREYITERIALSAANPRTPFRNDCIGYIGVGTGSQAEVSSVSALVEPVPFSAARFLAALDAPPEFPAESSRTAVTFSRAFGYGEISVGGITVDVTEAGLFTDGEPTADWSLEDLDVSAAAMSRAPMFYKTFEPITKTADRILRFSWEVRIA